MTHWFKFWLLAVIWGSSFLLIKIGVEELGPFPLVSIRIGLAALLFFVFIRMTGRSLPRWGNGLGALIYVGIFNTTIPFALISYGETSIDSGLATILNATVPLFNLIIAHFLLDDEGLTIFKLIGLATGFIGVIILVSKGFGSGGTSLVGQGAVLLASLSYASAITTIRFKLRHIDPFTTAGGSLIIGAIAIIPTTLLFAPIPKNVSPDTLLVAVTLAVVNTFVAYFLFYSLISEWGVRASLVTYAMPPIGISLGFLVLGEVIDWRLVAGGSMIIAGIIVTKSDNPLALLKILRFRPISSHWR